jgi:hypothetical protein
MKFSVLLSVYRKEQPAYLRQSLDSIFTQTLQPAEVVLVKDGPLTDALDGGGILPEISGAEGRTLV